MFFLVSAQLKVFVSKAVAVASSDAVNVESIKRARSFAYLVKEHERINQFNRKVGRRLKPSSSLSWWELVGFCGKRLGMRNQ